MKMHSSTIHISSARIGRDVGSKPLWICGIICRRKSIDDHDDSRHNRINHWLGFWYCHRNHTSNARDQCDPKYIRFPKNLFHGTTFPLNSIVPNTPNTIATAALNIVASIDSHRFAGLSFNSWISLPNLSRPRVS